MDAAAQLGELDYMQLMADMEQSFLDAMLQDEAAFLSQLEAQEVDSLVSPLPTMAAASIAWMGIGQLSGRELEYKGAPGRERSGKS